MKVNITFSSLIPRAPLIVFSLTIITILWVGIYLYIHLYKPIIAAEDIVVLRSEFTLQHVDLQAYEKIIKTQKARLLRKTPFISASLNPFLLQ